MNRLILCTLALSLASCLANQTVVLASGTAELYGDLARQPTIRMPLWHQPAGATIFCENDQVRVMATRHKDDTVKMRYLDGKTEVKELEHDDTPTGPVMKWPNGERAKRCGIHPASPLDTRAILQLGDYKVELKRTGPESMRVYVPNVDAIEVGYPLREQDRAAIKKLGVPAELMDLLP